MNVGEHRVSRTVATPGQSGTPVPRPVLRLPTPCGGLPGRGAEDWPGSCFLVALAPTAPAPSHHGVWDTQKSPPRSQGHLPRQTCHGSSFRSCTQSPGRDPNVADEAGVRVGLTSLPDPDGSTAAVLILAVETLHGLSLVVNSGQEALCT